MIQPSEQIYFHRTWQSKPRSQADKETLSITLNSTPSSLCLNRIFFNFQAHQFRKILMQHKCKGNTNTLEKKSQKAKDKAENQKQRLNKSYKDVEQKQARKEDSDNTHSYCRSSSKQCYVTIKISIHFAICNVSTNQIKLTVCSLLEKKNTFST